jgi:hypothetical protein
MAEEPNQIGESLIVQENGQVNSEGKTPHGAYSPFVKTTPTGLTGAASDGTKTLGRILDML